MIYLDNAATTRVFDCAVREAADKMSNGFFNPNSTYENAVIAHRIMENARRDIADKICAYPDEIVFTSCATESNNWVLECGRKNPKGNVVISAGEHPSVYEPAMDLKRRGFDVRVVPLDSSGIIDRDAFEKAVDSNTTLISIIHVSNETGAVNPIKELVATARKKAPRALFHSDGVQGFLKSKSTPAALGVDFYTASAHKIGAPKGIGLLYIKRGIHLSPFIRGGGQENGLRSGTQNTPYISAFAAAVKHFCEQDVSLIPNIRSKLCSYFKELGFGIVGSAENSGYILCVRIPDVKAEILQNTVHDKGVIVGKGSACSGSARGNRVLSAMGLTDTEVDQCIRISLFIDSDEEEVLSAAKIISSAVAQIRSINVR